MAKNRFSGPEIGIETSSLIEINYFQSKMRNKLIHFCMKTVNNIQNIYVLNIISTVLLNLHVNKIIAKIYQFGCSRLFSKTRSDSEF